MTLVSVVIPFYNSENYIEETIQSVLHQSFSNIEIICVDNNSTDKSREIVEQLVLQDNRIKILSETQPGANYARNKGLSEANGEFIQFLDADDVIVKDKLEKQVQVLQDESVDIVISDRATYNETLKEQLKVHEFKRITEQPLQNAISKIIITGNPLYRTEFVKSIGGYLSSLVSAQDWEFHIRFFLNKPKVSYLPGIYLHSRQLANSLSSDFISVSNSACSVILMYKSELVKHNVHMSNRAMHKILFTYLVSYVHTGNKSYQEEFVNWYHVTRKTKIFSGINLLLISVVGPKYFLKIKRFTDFFNTN